MPLPKNGTTIYIEGRSGYFSVTYPSGENTNTQEVFGALANAPIISGSSVKIYDSNNDLNQVYGKQNRVLSADSKEDALQLIQRNAGNLLK